MKTFIIKEKLELRLVARSSDVCACACVCVCVCVFLVILVIHDDLEIQNKQRKRCSKSPLNLPSRENYYYPFPSKSVKQTNKK